MTPRGAMGHRRCPVCGSRKLIPSLGHLRSVRTDEASGGAFASFSWRCRTCRTSMRANRPQLWRRRRPLANWFAGRT